MSLVDRFAVLALLALGCGGAPHDNPDASANGGAIQMNDVTILFPLTAPGSAIATAYLPASATGRRGVLLPATLYDAVGHIAGSGGIPTPGGTGDAAYADLHVVGVRIDPCFAALAPDPHGAGCTNQIRVVFQELTDDQGAVTAFDSGLHAFYRLSRDELVELATAIAALRASNSSGERLGGLGPHAIMVRQGMDGPMAAGVRDLVLRYAGADNLTRVTKLSAQNTGFTWAFSGFDVSDASAGTIAPMVIPTVATGTTSQTFFRGFDTDVAGQFSPATTSTDDLVPLADAQAAAALDPAARQAAFDGLVRVDNPTRKSPDTIDCASCHLATPVSRMIAQPTFALVEATNANAFAADGTFVLASEMAPVFDATGPFNLHAFSYVGTSPAVNQRTVNESAAIVAYLNTLAP